MLYNANIINYDYYLYLSKLPKINREKEIGLMIRDDVDENGNPVLYKISVASFIIDDLKNDDLLFKNEIHNIIFNIFDKALDEDDIPDEHYFVSHEDTRIAELAANLLSTPYKLDNWSEKEINVKVEEDVLQKSVVTSLLRFKDMIIDDKRNDLIKELMETHDVDDQMILLAESIEQGATLLGHRTLVV